MAEIWGYRALRAVMGLVLSLWALVSIGWAERQVRVEADGQAVELVTRSWTVAGALEEAGVKLEPGDLVVPDPHSPVTPGLVISVTRAVPVSVEADGKKTVVKVPVPTVAQVLAAAGLTLGPMDRVETNLGTGDKLYLKIFRVTQEIEVRSEAIPFKIERRADFSLERGVEKVVREGKPGLRYLKYRVTKEDGKEVKRELLDTWVEVQPQSKIIAYGTRTPEAVAALAKAGKVLEMEATAYTHTGNPTATGIYPYRGIVAVDPKVIPLGTRLYVEGYGYAWAQDTGGLIKGQRIDLFMETEKEAILWGRRRVKVYILE
ncbi:MAG: G5 domain-containing protein [Thermanaeromonas sp.]|uniref:3D domain-containing protein n=1 Tax=Thermanaeromonas sp. TaxID=2003697 RepID=UPI00243BC60A|nr:3D domain-containing protein [Thermanaeromonas sp.]MCG0277348.1 G5 domain-containing protein [Thermanaeromonas sp.]